MTTVAEAPAANEGAAKESKRRGAKTYYPGKEQKAITVNLTADARKLLKETQKRTKASRSDIFEFLLRTGAASVDFKDVTPTEEQTAT